MGQTPKYLFPWPEGTDPADGPDGIGDLARRVEEVLIAELGALDQRLDILEAAGPPPGSPTTQNGQQNLQAAVRPPAGNWTTLLSTPPLATGTWLIFGMLAVVPIDYNHPGYTTARLIGNGTTPKASAGGMPDNASHRLQLSLQSLAVIGASEPIRLQAENSVGNSNVVPVLADNPEGHTATILTWVKLA